MSSDPTPANLRPRSFSDVDASGQASEHAAYLERVAASVAERRSRWLDLLRLELDAVVLDAGSGMGEVTRMLAERVGPSGRAVGVDLSAELVERARERAGDVGHLEYRVGDLTALPFDDDTFDAAYSERVFIHLADPDAALRELLRVLRPGGRLVVVDPDHSQSVTDADDPELADLLTGRVAAEMVNWRSGRHLRSQAVAAGFTDVEVECQARVVTDREHVRRIAVRQVEDRLASLVADGVVTQARADAYLADQAARAAEGRFQVTIVIYVVTATKPAPRERRR